MPSGNQGRDRRHNLLHSCDLRAHFLVTADWKLFTTQAWARIRLVNTGQYWQISYDSVSKNSSS